MSGDLAPLRAWLAAHPSPDEPVAESRGGAVRIREDETRSVSLPYPHYSATIDTFWAAVEAAGFEVPDTREYAAVVANWQRARKLDTIEPEHIATMDRPTLFAVMRQVQRGERFCDGLWSAEFNHGTFHACARAVLALG